MAQETQGMALNPARSNQEGDGRLLACMLKDWTCPHPRQNEPLCFSERCNREGAREASVCLPYMGEGGTMIKRGAMVKGGPQLKVQTLKLAPGFCPVSSLAL